FPPCRPDDVPGPSARRSPPRRQREARCHSRAADAPEPTRGAARGGASRSFLAYPAIEHGPVRLPLGFPDWLRTVGTFDGRMFQVQPYRLNVKLLEPGVSQRLAHPPEDIILGGVKSKVHLRMIPRPHSSTSRNAAGRSLLLSRYVMTIGYSARRPCAA